MSSVTARTAPGTSAKLARSVICTGGFGTSRRMTFVMIASVPFGSDEQLRQVVADDVLDRLRPGAHDLAGGQHRLEPEDVAFGRAVLEGARTAGALGDVAADDRLVEAGRVRRIEQPDALHGVLQVAR